MNTKQYIDSYLSNYSKIKVKYLDELAKIFIKENKNIDDFQEFLKDKDNHYLRRIYFQVNLIRRKTLKEKFEFIDNNLKLLQRWEDTDMILNYLPKKSCKSAIFFKARSYIKEKDEFSKRLGYVLLLNQVYKEKVFLNEIFKLFENDERYYVLMAQAWVISYLYMKFPLETYDFLKNSNLSYKIKSKAISKILDSYQIDNIEKEKVRKLRALVK